MSDLSKRVSIFWRDEMKKTLCEVSVTVRGTILLLCIVTVKRLGWIALMLHIYSPVKMKMVLLKQTRSVSAPRQVLKWKHLKAHNLQRGGFPENFAPFMHLKLVTEELRLQNQ